MAEVESSVKIIKQQGELSTFHQATIPDGDFAIFVMPAQYRTALLVVDVTGGEIVTEISADSPDVVNGQAPNTTVIFSPADGLDANLADISSKSFNQVGAFRITASGAEAKVRISTR